MINEHSLLSKQYVALLNDLTCKVSSSLETCTASVGYWSDKCKEKHMLLLQTTHVNSTPIARCYRKNCLEWEVQILHFRISAQASQRFFVSTIATCLVIFIGQSHFTCTTYLSLYSHNIYSRCKFLTWSKFNINIVGHVKSKCKIKYEPDEWKWTNTEI